MTEFFTALNKQLGKYMFLGVLSGLFLGAFFPLTDSFFLRKAVVALFAYMTFVTALGTSLKQFVGVLRHPGAPILVLVLVHFVTPFVAWLTGILCYPDDPLIRIGYLVGASIPIGVTSVIWTSLVKGNLAMSLVAVTLDTFIVPIVLPLFFLFVLGTSVQLDYSQMIIDLSLMVTIPSIAGMLLHDATNGKVRSFSNSIGGATSKIGLYIVIFINSALVMPHIQWDPSIAKALIVTFFMVAASFFSGFLGSLLLKDNSRENTLTMIYNVGIRNNACGLVIALSYFPPSVAIPITLSILYQQPVATIVPYLYNKFCNSGTSAPAEQQL